MAWPPRSGNGPLQGDKRARYGIDVRLPAAAFAQESTGCHRVAIHFDVDTVDSNEIVLGLGAVPEGLTSPQVRRIVAEVAAAADVLALTIAEFFPRQVMHLQQILAGFPLISQSG